MMTDQEKQILRQKIQSNKHEIYVISFDEMDAIIRSSPDGSRQSVQAGWQKIKSKVGAGASYYASADDAVTVAKLVGDLGGIGAKAYIKTYGGKPHIILKGQPSLRRILTGTKYGIKNPKVVSMGLGKAGAVAAAKQGGILTMVLLTAYRVVDYVLTDEATLSQLIGTLATDVIKVGITTAASIGAAVVVGGITTLAIGPIVAVVAVGVGVAMLLEYADNSLGITDRVIAGIDELSQSTENYLAQQKSNVIDAAGRAVNSVIDLAIDSARTMAINWVRRSLREYLSPVRSTW